MLSDVDFADAITGVHMGPWDHCTICDISNAPGSVPGGGGGITACVGDVCTSFTSVSTEGVDGYDTTYQLSLELGDSIKNVYTIYGT